MTPEEFSQAIYEFFEQIKDRLEVCLPGEAEVSSPNVNGEKFLASSQIAIRLNTLDRREKSGELRAKFQLSRDRTEQHLSTEVSEFHIRHLHKNKAQPIVRFEYERNARSKPVAHVHFHSNSVPLAIALQRNGKTAEAFHQQDVHYPLGGHRYRVCIEDVIQLAIAELGYIGKLGWEEEVERGRENFRREQAAAVIRHNHQMAVEILEKDLGYRISGGPDEITETPGPRDDW